MFKFVYNEYGAPQNRVSYPATDSEAFAFGEAVMFSSGKLTKATNGSAVAGFALQALSAGTGQMLEITEAREGDVFDADYTGTPAGGFVVGVNTADVSTDGLSVLSSDVTGGAFAITSINTNTLKVRLKVKSRQLS